MPPSSATGGASGVRAARPTSSIEVLGDFTTDWRVLMVCAMAVRAKLRAEEKQRAILVRAR